MSRDAPSARLEGPLRGAQRALLLGALFLSASAAALPTKRWLLKLDAVPFQAKFSLSVDDGRSRDLSSGELFVRTDGSLCVQVEKPLRQRLSFGQQRLTIYYPDARQLLEAKPSPGHLPPMVDSLFLGFVDPSAILPPNAKILEQGKGPDGRSLITRWALEDGAGKLQGQLRAVESRDGMERLELLTADGQLARRYEFLDRVKLGAHAVPRTVTVLYKKPGSPDRTDRWTLTEVALERDTDPAAIECGAIPAGIAVKAITL